jgi:hypothetical protein
MVISLSYNDIINWLESCQKEKDIINYPHIISALNQYINVIKKLLYIMDDKEKKEFDKYLQEHQEKAILLLQNVKELHDSVIEYALFNNRRSVFFAKLAEKIKDILQSEFRDFEVILEPKHDEEVWWTLKVKSHTNKVVFLNLAAKSDENNIEGSWWGLYFNGDPINQWRHIEIGRYDDFAYPAKGMSEILNGSEEDLIKNIAQTLKNEIASEDVKQKIIDLLK